MVSDGIVSAQWWYLWSKSARHDFGLAVALVTLELSLLCSADWIDLRTRLDSALVVGALEGRGMGLLGNTSSVRPMAKLRLALLLALIMTCTYTPKQQKFRDWFYL